MPSEDGGMEMPLVAAQSVNASPVAGAGSLRPSPKQSPKATRITVGSGSQTGDGEEDAAFGKLPNRAIIHSLLADQDVLSCTFSPKGKYLVYGHAELTVVRTSDWTVAATFPGTNLDSVCFSKDSRYMGFCAASTCTVVMTKTWATVKIIDVGGPAHVCCFSHRGKEFIYGGSTRSLTMVETKNWTTLQEFHIEEDEMPDQPTGKYTEAGWSHNAMDAGWPDGKYLCFTHEHQLAVVFRGNMQVEYRTAGENINRAINIMTWSPEGQLIAYCNWKTLSVLDTKEWKIEKEMRAESEIHTIAFGPTGDNLCYGGEAGKLYIHDTSSWALVKVLDMNDSAGSDIIGSNAVLCCDLTLDQVNQRELMAYGGKSGRIDIVKVVSDWWAEAIMLPQYQQINDSDFSPDNRYLAVCDEGGHCYVLENEKNEDGSTTPYQKKVKEWGETTSDGKPSPLMACFWNGASTVLAFGGDNKCLTAVSAQDWSILGEVEVGKKINAGAYADAGDFIALACGLDPTAEQQAQQDQEAAGSLPKAGSVAFDVTATGAAAPADASSGKQGGDEEKKETENALVIISTATWQIIHVEPLAGQALAVEVGPNREWVAVSGLDETVTILDPETWKVVKTIQAADGIFVIRASPAGDLMAFGGEDMKMNVVSTVTWQNVTEPISAGGDWVWDCVFSPDGESLCFVCKGLTEVMVVSTATWGVVRDLKRTEEDEHDFSFFTCAFSPDGKYLVCGGSFYDEEGSDNNFRTFMAFPVGLLITKPPLRGAVALSSNTTDVLLKEIKNDPTRIIEVVGQLTKSKTSLAKLADILKVYPNIVVLDYVKVRDELRATGNPEDDIAPLLKAFIDVRDRGRLIDVFKACHIGLGAVKSLKWELIKICKTMPDMIVEFLECMELPTVDKIHVNRRVKDARVDTEADIYTTVKEIQSTREEGVPANLTRTPSPGLGSLVFLEVLLNKAPEDAWATPVMSLVIQGLWKQVYSIFNFGFYAHVAFTISVIFLATAVADPGGSQTWNVAYWTIVLLVLTGTSLLIILLNGVELGYLLGGCARDPRMIFVHLAQPLALTDIVSPFIALGITFQLGKEYMNDREGDFIVEYYEKVWVCILVLFATLSLMQYLRGFPTFAPLVVMLQEIVRDIMPFVFLLSVIMICFSFVWNIDLPELADNVYTGFFQTFVMGILADFGLDDLDNSETFPWFTRFIFFVMMFVVQVVMLNLLIAIMGSTYERVSDLQYITLRAARARTVLKQLTMISVFKGYYKRFEARNDLVYSLVPIAAQGRKKQEAWSGHLNALKKHMDGRVQEQLESFRSELQTIQEDVSQHAAMQEDLGDIKENLGLIMKHMKINRD